MPIKIPQIIAPSEVTSEVGNLVQLINALSVPAVGYAEKTDTSAATVTAAELTTGRNISVIAMTGNLGAGATLTLPTVALTVAALQAKFGAAGDVDVVGTSWLVRVARGGTGSFAWTLTTATGWGTLAGTLTVTISQWRDFLLTITSATTGTVQSIGAGDTP